MLKRLLIAFLVLFAIYGHAVDFKIRGVLPWHNFTCGPTGWNESDYCNYLDECQSQGINFIGFHNYTGGGERYASYVEPMIKISYKNIIPNAFFDNTNTARWGNVPMPIKLFPFGMNKYVEIPQGANAFGSDCAVLPKSSTEHYEYAQSLMKKVLKMSHERGMEMAMGFEFGVIPPEYYSLSVPGDYFYWLGKANMVPNPTHVTAREIHYAAIDNILETYPDIDWIWLWLNEHSFYSVDVNEAKANKSFADVYDRKSIYFSESGSEIEKFMGVWSLEYIDLTIKHLKERGSKAKIMIGGWGGGNQLPALLLGLNRVLPTDVAFSCLNPNMGTKEQPDFLKEIAKKRDVIAIPWLEGDDQLWHFQPRVNLIKNHVKLAYEQNLAGVAAIHWRTEDVKYNLKTFAYFAQNPKSDEKIESLYHNYFKVDFGRSAAKKLSPLFAKMDISQIGALISSPEFFAFSSSWGLLDEKNILLRKQILKGMNEALVLTKDKVYTDNLKRFKSVFEFELLLNQAVSYMQPAFKIKKNVIEKNAELSQEQFQLAYDKLLEAPIEKMLQTYAQRIHSRGEMAIFCSINQRLWTEYMDLKNFIEGKLRDKKRI